MKKIFIILCLLNSQAFTAEWTTGKYKINLNQDSNGDWSSDKCKSECSIDIAAKENIKLFKFDQAELSGGKNPGSVICKRILGQVIYLEHDKVSDAFCSYEGSTVSLSRLARLVL